MSKPKYNAQIYNMQLRSLGEKRIEIIVYSRMYVPGYDMNKMISYLINEQISVDDLLSEWEEKQNDVNKYMEIGEVSNQVIKDWIQEIIKVDTELKNKTKGGLRLQDIKGSLDDIRTTEYKDLKTIDFVNILIRNYNGDVQAMMKSAKKGELNTKMEEEEPNYSDDDNDIVIEKENKVPIKQDKSVDRIALKFGKFTIELPNDPSEVNVTDEELEGKLEENHIQIQGTVFIFYEDSEDNENQEKQIQADISKLFSNYKDLEKWMKDKEVTEEPLKYLIKLIINDMKDLGMFQLAVQTRYERREKEKIRKEKEAAEREKKKAEKEKKEAEAAQKKAEGKKGLKLKEMRSMQSEIQDEVGNSTKKKGRRIIKESSTSTGITTEKKEPVQQSSTIPIGAFPGEQSNNVSGINTVNEDLGDVQNEKESFKPAEYGLPEQIEIGGIKIKIDGKELDMRDASELSKFSSGTIANTILGDKLKEVEQVLERYNEYFKEKYKYEVNDYQLLLLLLRDQGKIKRYEEIYNDIYERQKRIEEENERKQREIREREERRRLEEFEKQRQAEEQRKRAEEQIRLKREEEEKRHKEEEEKRKKEEEEKKKQEDLLRTKLESTQKGQNEKGVEMKQKEDEQNKFDIRPQGNPFSAQNMNNVVRSNATGNYKFGYFNPNGQPITQIIQPNIPSNPPTQGMNTNQFGTDLGKPEKINELKPEERDLKMREDAQDFRREYKREHKYMNVTDEPYERFHIITTGEIIGAKHAVLSGIRHRKRKEQLMFKRSEPFNEFDKRMREIYGELYDIPVTRENMTPILLGMINRLLGISINKEYLDKILESVKLNDEIIKGIKIRYDIHIQLDEKEYKVLFLIGMKYDHETLKSNLENIIRQIQGNAVTE